MPIAIDQDGAQWEPLIMPRLNQDLPVIITFINYEILATPRWESVGVEPTDRW